MISVTGRRPFSELGDQQLLEQTWRLAANQRCLEVHILDHLDEIDRRGLALRRGFSSLFDYAVRELRFSDAAAQRRIQAMRLCRRHGWVRARLQSGALSMTSAGQLETTFAGAERAERQSHTGHRNVGQGRGHDQDHDCAGGIRQLGLPAAPGEAVEQGERGHRSAPGGAPPAGGCSGDVATGNTPAVPVASRAGAQAPGTGHAGAPLPLSELNGTASPFPAPSCAPVAAHGAGAGAGAGSAAPSSDEGPAPQLLPPTDLSASASTPEPVPEPVVAPSESRPTASRASEPLRDDPFAELSPGTVSAAPLLHPQRQRELIEQAAGMSTRQVASLLAAAAPEVLPPRDTLRAAAPDRYTLKVSIDQECEQGLRLLKDLMSHVDPRMSWGDLVARLVRDAVARHDPRGGGRGQRRKGADSAGASPRRAPKETRAAGAAGGPAQRVGEASGRAPNRTGAAGAAAGPAQRADESSGRAPNRTRAAVAPVAPALRTGGAAPAPLGDTAAIEGQHPIGVLASAAPPSQSAPASPLDGASAGGAPSGASAATSAPQSAPAARLDGARAGCAPSGASAATSAPQSAPAARLDGARVGCAPSGASAATSAPQSAPAARLDGARAGGAPSGASAATSAPQSAHAARLDGARAGCAPSGASAATSAPQSAPAARLDGARAGGAPSGASVATSAPKFASGALADGSHAGTAVPGTPVATSAPQPALGGPPDGGPSSASAGAAAAASAVGFSARAGEPGSPVATSAPEPALGAFPGGGPPDASAGAAAHPTRDSAPSRHQSPPRRHIPAAVRRHVWLRDGGRCCYRDPLSGRRCTSSHLLQIDHLLPVAEGGGPEPSNLVLLCFAHHRMRHGYGPAVPPEPPM